LCKLYADDLKLYSIIQTRQDASELQSCHALVAWSDQCQLTLSSKKSAVFCLGQTDIDQCYVVKQANLSLIPEIRDLGLLIDNKLTMSQHISTVVKKVRTRASLFFNVSIPDS